MKYWKPLINLQADSYNHAFILASILSSLTAIFAIFYTNLSKRRVKEMDNCKNKKNLFCMIHKHPILSIINNFIHTFYLTLVSFYILYIIFGYGGASLIKYKKPELFDIQHFGVTLVKFFAVIYLYYALIIMFSHKVVPRPLPVLYAVLFDFGLEHRFLYKNLNSFLKL
jgi:hypothetical protein